LKLASLFDGIGGFPLAATMLGIEPVWASEIEKFPITVTKESFPNMKHLGSVCDINGAEVEPVDIITFGSPCQDLSFAGKRAGMGEGTRSGLFSEAARIIKEMRDGTEKTFPRYAVWENVPGAFSSNHGEDFRAVVESLAKVAEETVSIPLPQDGKWEPAGLVEGDGWSIAWRTLDAQFWGVPQRRKRIFLVADFGGQCASEIFFEREGVSWNPAKSGSAREEVTGGVEGGVRATGFDGYNGAETGEQSATLGVNCGMSTGRNGVRVYPINGMVIGKELKGDERQTTGIGEDGEPSPTIRAQGHQHSVCCLHATQDPITAENRSHALGANSSQVVLFEPRSQDGVPRIHESGICPTLNTAEGGQRQPCVLMDASGSIGAALTANNGDSVNNQTPLAVNQSVRRLTPLECERLQGFPDNWTNISGAFDSSRYKALGNSVAIPCVYFILSCLRREL
jgi:DNA (cytosine-5)-methyltransferase 1